jgi:phosphoribosyl-AMP cyclohydrolase
MRVTMAKAIRVTMTKAMLVLIHQMSPYEYFGTKHSRVSQVRAKNKKMAKMAKFDQKRAKFWAKMGKSGNIQKCQISKMSNAII